MEPSHAPLSLSFLFRADSQKKGFRDAFHDSKTKREKDHERPHCAWLMGQAQHNLDKFQG